MRARSGSLALLLLLLGGFAAADVLLTEGTNFTADVFPGDGRVVFDLAGKIWLLPATGGEAVPLTDGLHPARQPRWSPDGSRVLYQVQSPQSATLAMIDIASRTSTEIGESRYFDRDGAWHPGGERIVFSSARNDTGFDLWERDLPTGLSWRLSARPGDESAPAWSGNGRHLAYIHQDGERYALVLRRHGEPEIDLLVSEQPLSAPAWRPDGSLLTVLREVDGGHRLDMIVLSSPPLIRPFITDENLFVSPVSWRSRQQMVYTADGLIKTRDFADRRGRPLHFTALVPQPAARPATRVARRELMITNPPEERLVVRSSRLFDGIWTSYRQDMDVLIENGRIAAVEPRRDWPEATVLDLGDVTVLPGFIDAWSAMPTGPTAAAGSRLLSYGVTTIVTSDKGPGDLAWEGAETPGPRVLSAINIGAPGDGPVLPAWVAVPRQTAPDEALQSVVADWQDRGVLVLAESYTTGMAIGADLLPGGDALARSGTGSRGGNLPMLAADTSVVLLSGMADASTPGLAELLGSRQASELHQQRRPQRRFAARPQRAAGAGSFVLGSKPNRLPPGLALHAELRALAAAGLSGHEVLNATGHGAATILGVDNQIGRITPGAAADLVLVRGDPLADPADALSIVAVVRNGRFFSLVSLLERASAGHTVE